ncbi:MAG: glutaredoxin [Proteobacteria bacterium SG_bin7]|nr:MAG: glutaredoxin [Proteobacteria bacterium SG_bin7]
MTSKIKIYSTKSCPYCIRAKSYFAANDLKFEEIDLTNNFSEIDRIKAKTGHRTVPLIFVNEQFIGGYTDMISKIESGELVLK